MRVIVLSLLAACLFQGIRWGAFGLLDDTMWAAQAHYVRVSDPREFDATQAYGHPGGTIIIGTLFFHACFHLSYGTALLAFLTLFNGVLIACCAACIHAMYAQTRWTVAACGMLSLDQLYAFATPPSAVSALLSVLLCLLTLSIAEKRENVESWRLTAWSVVLGMSVATRADMGVICGAFFAFVLLSPLGWRKVGAMLAGGVAVFVVCDPFMYFMPIRHARDLIGKVVFHYAEIAPVRMSLAQIIRVSWLLAVSVCCGPGMMLVRAGYRSPIPGRFLWFLLALTGCLYAIFLTAQIQMERYFLPIVFIWHVLLPGFLLALAPEIAFSFLGAPARRTHAREIYRRAVPVVLVGYQLISLTCALVVNRLFPLR